MRELRGDDLFNMLHIVGKLDIKDEFIKLFEEQQEKIKEPQDYKKKQPTKVEKEKLEKEIERKGMEVAAALIQKLLTNLINVKEDINKLLADLCGVSNEEIKKLGFKEYTGLIIEFFKKKELLDFFKSIASLLQ